MESDTVGFIIEITLQFWMFGIKLRNIHNEIRHNYIQIIKKKYFFKKKLVWTTSSPIILIQSHKSYTHAFDVCIENIIRIDIKIQMILLQPMDKNGKNANYAHYLYFRPSELAAVSGNNIKKQPKYLLLEKSFYMRPYNMAWVKWFNHSTKT